MRAPALVDVTRRGRAALLAVVALALVGAAAVGSVRPPPARSTSAPDDQFSAARAVAFAPRIATVPHPVGSAAQAAVRGELVSRLRSYGLAPQVQDATSVEGGQLSSSAGGVSVAHVQNVVTLIPGSASTGRIFLVAHYDSVQTGPGANDDAAGVEAMLEIGRILAKGPRPRNDVVLVMTDGEEACLCGAQAFVDQNPLAKGGGVVLNMEARGSSGPAIMFETSTDNEKLVDAYAKAPDPVGTSFAVEIYRLLPNDTDFTAFREAGFTGLNAAYIDGAAVYHAPTDTISSMDRDSLQHQGENVLELARDLGGRDLSTLGSGQDATYFPVPLLLVRYSGWLVWPLAVLALLAVAGLTVLARRLGLLTGRRAAAAAGLTLIPLVVAPVLAQLYWKLLVLFRPAYAELPIDPYRPQWYRLGVIALTALVVLAWYAVLRRRIGPAAAAVAGLGWLAGLGVVLAALTPGGSYLAALPALFGAVAAIVALRLRGAAAVIVAVVGAAVAVVILLPAVVMLFPALGLGTGGAGAFLTVLLGLAVLPIVELMHPDFGERGVRSARAARVMALPTIAAALAVVVFTGVGLGVDRFDAGHPALTQLMYALDVDHDRAEWISDEATTQKWTSQYVSGKPHRVDDLLPALGDKPVRTGTAQAAALPAPTLAVESDTRSGDQRTLTLRLTPQRQVRLAALHVGAATPVLSATVDGRSVPAGRVESSQWGFGFLFHGPPADGVEITLTLRASGQVTFRAMDGSDGLNSLPGFKARPAGVGIVGSHTSELLAVAKTYTF